MSEFLFLGLEIFLGVWAGSNFAGHALDHADASSVQGFDLVRIVRQQTDVRNAQRFQNLAGQGKFAVVGFKSEPLVGFHCVEARILEFVCLQLGHQPNAASFLLFIDQDARTFLGNQRKRKLELLTAVATQGVKDVTRQTLRVDAHQRWPRCDITHHQSNGFLDPASAISARFAPKSINAEPAPTGGEISRGYLLYCIFCHPFIIARMPNELEARRLENEPDQTSVTLLIITPRCKRERATGSFQTPDRVCSKLRR